MNKLFGLFAKRASKNGLRIKKSRTGDNWEVRKGFHVLYIGSKEKCEIFFNRTTI
ncbi:MAG: hypothetical protein ABJG78_17275 [Cyclobacteriaceae bacterium]